jgi:transposase
MARTKGGMKLRMTVEKLGHPLRVLTTEGTEPDCKRALDLVASLDARCILAGKVYDSDKVISSLSTRGIVPVIPPKIKSQRSYDNSYDKNIYKKRHIVENTFLRTKAWRSLSTRYFKNVLSFFSTFHVHSLSLLAA